MAKISLIVPVLNEVQKIDGFLNQLKGLPGDWEAIFADGGSTDGTTEKITAHYPVIPAPKGRARQMNERSEERRVGDESRSRWSPTH